MNSTPKSSRNSLWSKLVLVLFLLLLATFGISFFMPQGLDRQEWEAAEAIHKLGGAAVPHVGLFKLYVGWVYLRRTKVTDAELKYLEAFSRLHQVDLEGTQVTDAGLKHLKGLSQLRDLGLQDTKITDGGLEQLEALSHLYFLDLRGTQVTDAGLVHLTALTELEVLQLEDTKVTDEGVKKLQKALPNCRIESGISGRMPPIQ